MRVWRFDAKDRIPLWPAREVLAPCANSITNTQSKAIMITDKRRVKVIKETSPT